MLNITKSINLNGESKIGDVTVAYLSASVSSNSNTTITKNIVSQELYQINKEVIKKDMSEFETKVYSLVDELVAEIPSTIPVV